MIFSNPDFKATNFKCGITLYSLFFCSVFGPSVSATVQCTASVSSLPPLFTLTSDLDWFNSLYYNIPNSQSNRHQIIKNIVSQAAYLCHWISIRSSSVIMSRPVICSFQCACPCLWNNPPPLSFCQPRLPDWSPAPSPPLLLYRFAQSSKLTWSTDPFHNKRLIHFHFRLKTVLYPPDWLCGTVDYPLIHFDFRFPIFVNFMLHTTLADVGILAY